MASVDEPSTPRATSIVVAASVFVTDDGGRVLLVRDGDGWALPGGDQQLGEYLAQSAVRHTRTRSGVDVEVTGVVGVYSNPHHVVAEHGGQVRQEFSVCLRARYLGGRPGAQARWVGSADLDGVPIHPATRLRIDHGYNRRPEAYLD